MAVSFLNACDISLACVSPYESAPISPSISALGVRAATESMTITSIPPERTKLSVISKACSPVSGWDINKSSIWTPVFSVFGVKSMFGVNESANTALFWVLSYNVQSQSGFAGRFRAVNFYNSSARHSADAQSDVQTQRAGRHHIHIHPRRSPSFIMEPSPNLALISLKAFSTPTFTSLAFGFSFYTFVIYYSLDYETTSFARLA